MAIRHLFSLLFCLSTASAAAQDRLITAGQSVFVASCERCHIVGPVDPAVSLTKAGPHLNNLFGRKPGDVPEQLYSLAMVNFGKKHVWDEATLRTFLRGPTKKVMDGSNMRFDGLKSEEEISALLMYLATFDKDGMSP